MKAWMRMMAFAAVIVGIVAGGQTFGEQVKGYSSYIQLLPGGKDKQKPNIDMIEKAKDDVVAADSDKKNREIKFDRPIDVTILNSKYTMIGFDVQIRTKTTQKGTFEPAVYALLFEGTGRQGLVRYASRFIKWTGKDEVDVYRKSQARDFCDSFRKAGVEDCVAGADVDRTAQETRKSSAGTYRPENLDKTYARKQDVERSIDVSNGKIDRLNATIAAQNEKIEKLMTEIRAREAQSKTVTGTINDPKNVADQSRQLDTRIAQLEKSLEEQAKITRDYAQRINTLTQLLQGVSRNGATLMLSGLNLQIVNGSGQTSGHANGMGNLIIGYNEKKPGEPIMTGSHNLIAPGNDLFPEITEPAPKTAQDPVVTGGTETDKKGGFFKGSCFISSLID